MPQSRHCRQDLLKDGVQQQRYSRVTSTVLPCLRSPSTLELWQFHLAMPSRYWQLRLSGRHRMGVSMGW